MRPELEMVSAVSSILAARHYALRANIGIQTGGMRHIAAFDSRNIATFTLWHRQIKGRRLSSEGAALERELSHQLETSRLPSLLLLSLSSSHLFPLAFPLRYLPLRYSLHCTTLHYITLLFPPTHHTFPPNITGEEGGGEAGRLGGGGGGQASFRIPLYKRGSVCGRM